MYPDLRPAAAGRPQALTRAQFRRIMNAVQRANRDGKEQRIQSAQEKRDRKNAKRAASHCGVEQPGSSSGS